MKNWTADNPPPPLWGDGYRVGHDEGESCRQVDWDLAFQELTSIDDAIDPWGVARYVGELESLAAGVEFWVEAQREYDAATGRASAGAAAKLQLAREALLARLVAVRRP